MTSLRISEVTDRTGVPATALRFYEKVGIVVPGRADNGYRTYDDTDLERLEFVMRAKAVGLSLEQAAELLALRDLNECGPVQDRLSSLVRSRMLDARARAAELDAFADELALLLHQLGSSRPDGPCDESCGCLTDAAAPPAQVVHFTGAPVESTLLDACSLDRTMIPQRLDDWRTALTGSDVRIDGDQAVVELATETDLGLLGSLMAAESACCSFFEFRLDIDANRRRLTVSTSSTHWASLLALVGASA